VDVNKSDLVKEVGEIICLKTLYLAKVFIALMVDKLLGNYVSYAGTVIPTFRTSLLLPYSV